jgi:hypothetical protein
MTLLITEYPSRSRRTDAGIASRTGVGKPIFRIARLTLFKIASNALAEFGGTPHEIMAITGHQTLEEVERYTKMASRKKAADAAMAKLG